MKIAGTRKAKIAELKQKIEEGNQLVKKVIDLWKAKETTEEKKKEYRRDMNELFSVIQGLQEELKLTKMNKYHSSAFKWTPSPPNRRYRKAMLINTRKWSKNERNNGVGIEDTTDSRDSNQLLSEEQPVLSVPGSDI